MKQILLLLLGNGINWPLDTHSAMSRYPQEAAAWRGIQPSLSGWLMAAPFSTRKVTMSTLSSMHAWERKEKKKKVSKVLPLLCVCADTWAYVSRMVTISLHWKSIAMSVQNCWAISADGAWNTTYGSTADGWRRCVYLLLLHTKSKHLKNVQRLRLLITHWTAH